MSLFNWNKSKKESEEAPKTPSPTYPPKPLNPARTIKSVSPHGKVVVPHGTQVIGPQSHSSTQLIQGNKSVSFFSSGLAVADEAPPAPPPEDKDIYLELGDIVERVPPGLLGDVTPHLKRHISFRLSEIFPDLAKGRATIPLSVLYSFCPELFAKPVSPDDSTPISLPLQKLVEQVGAFNQRPDQVHPEDFSQFDTPISKVAEEDAERMRPLKSSAPQPTVQSDPVPSVPRPSEAPLIPAPEITSGGQNPAPEAAQPSAPRQHPLPPPRPPQTVTPIIPAPATLQRPQSSTSPSPATPLSPPQPPLRIQSPQLAPTSNSPSSNSPNLFNKPPATVRASFAGGKITLRASPPPPEAGAPQPTPSAAVTPLPNLSAPRLDPSFSAKSPSGPAKGKATARIQLPALRLQSASAPSEPFVTKAAPELPKLAPVAPRPVPFNLSAPQPLLKTDPPETPLPKETAEKPQVPFIPKIPVASAPESLAAEPPSTPASIQTPLSAPSGRPSTITIPLKKIVKGLPPDIAKIVPDSLSDEATISLDAADVERQLARGSVKLSGAEFIKSLPADLQAACSQIPEDASIALPLAEVFAALPQGSLATRRDQVTEQLTEVFDTPFSKKAEEDAHLVTSEVPPPKQDTPPSAPALPTPPNEDQPAPKSGATPNQLAQLAPLPAPKLPPAIIPPKLDAPQPASPPSSQSEPSLSQPETSNLSKSAPIRPVLQPPRHQAVTPLIPARPPKSPEPERAESDSPLHGGSQTELQALFMTEEHLDAKGIVRHIARLPGIAGCHLMFSDGLPIAGNLPEGYNAEAFSALAPRFFSRLEEAARELAIGEVTSATIFTNRSPVSFMANNGIGLAIVHSRDRFLPGVREKLMAIMKEVGRIYAPVNS